MNDVMRKFIHALLKDVKSLAAQGKMVIFPRQKTVKFMRDHGFLDDDLKEFIFNLSPDDFNPPAEEDRDGFPGQVYKFKTFIDNTYVYIKIRYNPPDEVVCISFHEDE
jgi:hypothetical protein